MLTTKNISKLVTLILLLCFINTYSQKPSVYKINDLTKRIFNNSDTAYVVNFWATWCKPCVAELPEFEKLYQAHKHEKVKVLLVSMDFKEELDKKLKEFLEKNKYNSEILLLDEVNGNDFINKISESWSGAIPATLIVKPGNPIHKFHEGKLNLEMLEKLISEK